VFSLLSVTFKTIYSVGKIIIRNFVRRLSARDNRQALKTLKTPDCGICISLPSVVQHRAYTHAIRQYGFSSYCFVSPTAAAADAERRFPLVFIPY